MAQWRGGGGVRELISPPRARPDRKGHGADRTLSLTHRLARLSLLCPDSDHQIKVSIFRHSIVPMS